MRRFSSSVPVSSLVMTVFFAVSAVAVVIVG